MLELMVIAAGVVSILLVAGLSLAFYVEERQEISELNEKVK